MVVGADEGIMEVKSGIVGADEGNAGAPVGIKVVGADEGMEVKRGIVGADEGNAGAPVGIKVMGASERGNTGATVGGTN
jgi:hypothetical protein